MEFSKKGYELSKMFVYMISELDAIDSRDMENNNNLKTILNLKAKYKISMIILLTHSDIFCEKIKKQDKNWKETCKKNLNNNKKQLLKWINSKFQNVEIDENNIRHILLVNGEKIEITDEYIINNFDEEQRADYEEEDDKGKMKMIRNIKKTMMKKENEISDFLNKEINILGEKELIEELKNYIPSQFHNSLIGIN